MSVHRFRWLDVDGADSYHIYMSHEPGGEYVLKEMKALPSYDAAISMGVRDLNANDLAQGKSLLSWVPPESIGCPALIKVPYEKNNALSFQPEPDDVWLHGELEQDMWWAGDGPAKSSWPFFSEKSWLIHAESRSASFPLMHESPMAGNAIIWTWLPEDARPETLWFEFHDGEEWSKAVYFGQDLFFDQEKGRDALHLGEPPSANSWVPLIIPLWRLGIEEAFGISFGLGSRKSSSSMYVGAVCHTTQPVLAASSPHTGLKEYHILRNGLIIGKADAMATQFTDSKAYDELGFGGSGPDFFIIEGEAAESAFISWHVPSGQGTSYLYEVVPIDYNNSGHSVASVGHTASDSYEYVKIYADTEPITEQTPLLAIETGASFLHEGLQDEATHYYRFDVYGPDDKLLFRKERRYTPTISSRLDSFRLDVSRLA